MSGAKPQQIEPFDAQWAGAQYAFVHMLTEHLVDCRRAFRGDLDAMLVLAILGQNHLKALLAGETDARTPGTPFGITASRIADVTGMPRQTVRRKLQDLAKRGWLIQNGDAAWMLSGPPDDTSAGQDLAELSHRGLGRAMRLRDDLNRILGPAKGA
ncbi:helix-turn-helix domain-containing protein [Bosea sp. (in: a-proteobacteria)]|uniref:helix-turn-helix domain-containing protein n=1 Tax=Bosea sp. (in: a-proteobacteria) TaxID=1871050 RepID=UPI0025BFE1FE|nr:helix-turn-helix domain-containing protein [Bosea sp. (in: a-proteobacteria)]